jgi:hypothetical protein
MTDWNMGLSKPYGSEGLEVRPNVGWHVQHAPAPDFNVATIDSHMKLPIVPVKHYQTAHQKSWKRW